MQRLCTAEESSTVHSGGKKYFNCRINGELVWFGRFFCDQIFFLFRGTLSYKRNFLCFLSCRCPGVATRCCWPLSKAHFEIDLEKQNKTKKSMPVFDWRTRQLGWRSHVCLRAGHCWVPASSSGVRDERTIMSVDSQALCESRGQRLESLWESCCLSIRCKILFLTLLSALPLLSFVRWPLGLHSPRASV